MADEPDTVDDTDIPDDSTTVEEVVVVASSGSTYQRYLQRALVAGLDFPIMTSGVKQTGFFHADTFEASIPLWIGSYDHEWWLTQMNPTEVEIQYGEADDSGEVEWTSMLKGLIDQVEAEPDLNTVRIKGRDKTCLLIDLKLREAYRNKTSSEVVQLLADRVGLGTDLTATTTLVGTYYDGNHQSTTHDTFSKAQNAWDLITILAHAEGFKAWVKDDLVHFKAAEEYEDDPWIITWAPPTVSADGQYIIASNASVKGLKITHNLQAAKDISVTVRSWHSWNRQGTEAVHTGPSKAPAGFNATYGATKGQAAKNDKVSSYTFEFPNLTPEQAQVKAQQIYDDLTQHEYIVEFEMPGDVTKTARRPLLINGGTTTLDQTFYADEVNFSMDFDAGFGLTVHAKNHPEASEETGGGQ
jgi:hypothetical protein